MIRDISKLHWITREADESYSMVLDHQILSSWRMCQAHFELLHVRGFSPKGNRNWSLEFGALLHVMIEDIYKWRKEGTFDYTRLVEHASKSWDEARMDDFAHHRTYKALGGKMGFIVLCGQYSTYYTQDSERIRIIGTEVGFGRNKEVPLGQFLIQKDMTELIRVNCFLAGIMDFIGDDGNKIGPVDHKTRAAFAKVEHILQYNPHEGITGYIYATQHILKRYFPEMAAKRKCNSAWLNFIQVTHEDDVLKRFKRGLVMRTDYQLEQWRLRQLESFKDIFNYLNFGRVAQWNTEACTHWYGTNCTYHAVHRQPDEQSQLTVLQSDYKEGQFWNCEERDDVRNKDAAKSGPVSGDNQVNEPAMQEQDIQHYPSPGI